MQSLSLPCVMGILNVTPDSFSDGGRYLNIDDAVAHAQQMVAEGATIIDIGGESTRPGAPEVPLQTELDRVLPVLERLHAAQLPALLSVDTTKAEVMRAAIAAGVDIINDINALRGKGCLAAITGQDVYVCLMHMQGTPRTMQHEPYYHDVVNEVKTFLVERVNACTIAGIAREQLIIDPGFGFGKTLSHNLLLLQHLHAFAELDLPILVGTSRKSMLGQLLDKPVEQRVAGGLALTTIALQQGAQIIRTHDVAETVDVLRVTQALLTCLV